MNARDRKIDTLRGIAVMFAVLIHISADYARMSDDKALFWVLNFVNKLLLTAVPTFVTLTVFLGLKSSKPKGGKYLLRKIAPITALYLIWSGIYLWFYTANGRPFPESEKLIFENLLQGSTCYHLYYIVMLLQLYVLIAVLSHVPVKKIKPSLWLPFVAAAAQLIVLFLFDRLIIKKFWFYNTSILVIFYLTPVCYGLMLAADKEKTEAMFKKYFPFYAAVYLSAATARMFFASYAAKLFTDGFLYNLADKALWEIFIIGGIGVMFLLGKLLNRFGIFSVVGKHSLGIYFFHPLVLALTELAFTKNDLLAEKIEVLCLIKLVAAVSASLGYAAAAEYIKNKRNSKKFNNFDK